MSPAACVLGTLMVYMVVLLAIGIVTARRSRDEADFYLAGRGIGPWIASLSASASSSSAWTLLGVSGLAYSKGLAAVWLFPSCVGGFAINWYWLAPRVRDRARESGALTLTDLIAGPGTGVWNRRIRVLASLVILVFFVFYLASQFDAAGASFDAAMEGSAFVLPMPAAMALGGGIVLFYTLMGGFWAVSVSDVLQGGMMVLAAIALPTAALLEVGPAQFLAGMRAVPDADFGDLWHGLPPIAALGFVLGLFGIGLNYPGQPHVVNRFMAMAGGATELRRARRMSMLWAVLIYAGMILTGLAGRILAPDLPNPEQVFVRVSSRVFPPVLSGMMTAAILSAIMSTADSQLLVASSAVTRDLAPGGPDRPFSLLRARLVIVAICVAAYGLAVWHPASIFDRVLFAFSAMGAAFGPVLVVRLLRGPMSGPTVFCAVLTGLLATLLAKLLFDPSLVRLPAGWSNWSGAAERVAPPLLALAVALGLGRESTARSRSGP